MTLPLLRPPGHRASLGDLLLPVRVEVTIAGAATGSGLIGAVPRDSSPSRRRRHEPAPQVAEIVVIGRQRSEHLADHLAGRALPRRPGQNTLRDFFAEPVLEALHVRRKLTLLLGLPGC